MLERPPIPSPSLIEAEAQPLGTQPREDLRPEFDQLYEEHCDFVWRSLRRLGVAEAHLPDSTQEVFLAAFRHWGSFEGRASMKTWLFSIARGIARDYRRSAALRWTEPLDEMVPDARACPAAEAEFREAAALMNTLLNRLEAPKREVFVLVELEQMQLPEVADALGINVNTAYSRLRTARKDFEQALARHQARDPRRAAKE